MSLYIGKSDTNKNVGNLFVGVNNTPKEVSELYEVRDGEKRLVFNGIDVDRGLTKVNPIRTLKSGKFTKDDIGKTVYLSNSSSQCQEWVIADVNHDDEDGSVDLFPKYVLVETVPDITYGTQITYFTTKLRRYLNDIFIYGFTDDVRNSLSYLEYKYVNTTSKKDVTMSDKIKPPTQLEVGVYSSGYSSLEKYYPSKIYPYFGSTAINTNTKAIVKNISNTPVAYCLRTMNSSYSCLGISEQGTMKSSGSGAVGFIRFKPKNDLSDIEAELLKPNPVELLMSGKLDKSYIGRTVLLGNYTHAYNTTQEWVIADINHSGGRHYTIDLVSKYIFTNSISFGSGGKGPDYSVYYPTCNIRPVFNDDMYKGFCSKVRDNLSPFYYNFRGTVIRDIIKCPSFVEMGIESSYSYDDGSKIYPLFGPSPVKTNQNAIREYFGEKMEYWVRDYGGNSHGACITDKGTGTIEAFEASSTTDTMYHGAVGIIRFAKLGDDATVDEILRSKIDPAELLSSGRITANDIGKIVNIYNYDMPSVEWIIADVNHDGTSGTIDLISKYPNWSAAFGSSANYDNVNMNSRLERILQGFNYSIQRILTDMSYRCGSGTLSKKVKLLSLNEVGLSMAGYDSTDGELYPIFKNGGAATTNMYGDGTVYWLRNTCTNGSRPNTAAVVLGSGTPYYEEYGSSSYDGTYCNYSKYLRPVIRVKVK